jgi:hypothetical protein
MRAIAIAILATAMMAVAVVSAPVDAASTRLSEKPFFVAMLVSDPDIVVGRSGPLSLVARCFTPAGTAATRFQLLMSSTIDDWSLTGDLSDPVSLPNLPAGERLIFQATNTLDPSIETPGTAGTSALAPDGRVLTVGSDTVMSALNLYDFDCVASGVVTVINGRLR